MATAPLLVLIIQLSVLLLSSSFTAFGDDVDIVSWAQPPHHHLPPSYPPAAAPKPYHHHRKIPPPPAHPPHESKPPSYPPRKRSPVAVRGVVYCKSCKYSGGVDTLSGATPLLGAVVKLQCNNTKYPIVQEAKTDKNGYFFILAEKRVTTFGSHKCKVSLVTSPVATCSKMTNLHYGRDGALLIPVKPTLPLPPHPPPFELFTVGPFAFEPPTKCPL